MPGPLLFLPSLLEGVLVTLGILVLAVALVFVLGVGIFQIAGMVRI